jgi:uncharacterized membrane protein
LGAITASLRGAEPAAPQGKVTPKADPTASQGKQTPANSGQASSILSKSSAVARGVRIQRSGAALSNIATAISPGGEWVPDNLRDPGFDHYVDLALLCKAWDEKNASALADVALQFREGERVLLRPRRGFTSQQLLDEAARIAAETKQAEALQRLRKIAETTGSTDLKAKLASMEKLAGPARAADPALQVSIAEMMPQVFAEVWEYFHAIQDAGLTGDTATLKEIQDDLANNTRIPEKQKKYLQKLLQERQATMAALPESQKQLSQALDKLSDSSRRGSSGGGGGSHSGGGGSHASGGHTSSAHTFSAHTTGGKSTLGKSTLGKSTLGKSTLGKSTLGKSTLGKSTLGKSTLGNKNLGNKNLGNKTLAGHDLGHPGLHRFPSGPTGGRIAGVPGTGTVPVSPGLAVVTNNVPASPGIAVVTTNVPGTTTTNAIPPAISVTTSGGGDGDGDGGGGDGNGGGGGGNGGSGGGTIGPPTGPPGTIPPGCHPNPPCPPDHHHHHHWRHYGWYFVDGQWVYYNCNCGCGDVAVADTAVYGGLWFENLQDEEVTVAIVYYDPSAPTWMVTGWYVVEPGERVCVMNGDVSNQTFYYYAFSTNWEWEGDDGNYYVDPDNSFSYDSQDPAAVSAAKQAGYENHGFNEIDVGDATPYFLQKLQ